jgi:BirA family transcriptional regulator, biotin operon repressor / biotin---[acetyl-CoA-carboxylase] ligase
MEKPAPLSQDHPLELDVLQEKLHGTFFSRNILLYRTLESTNTQAKELASAAAPEGTLVIAEEQTAGRGRMGRRWLSPPYANLLFSLLLRPAVQVDRVFTLTMTFALSAIEALEACTSISPGIKWPNDLYVNHRKLGGILTEFSVVSGAVEYVILGFGLNVNWNPGADEEMLYPATSVEAETGSRVSRTALLAAILRTFERSYIDLLTNGPDPLQQRWNKRCLILGEWVEIETPDGRICGRALGIDREGALMVMDQEGRETAVRCGDVSMRDQPRSS